MSKNEQNTEIPEIFSAMIATDGETIIGIPLAEKNPEELRVEIPVTDSELSRLCGVSKSTPEQMATVNMAIKNNITEIPATVSEQDKNNKDRDSGR